MTPREQRQTPRTDAEEKLQKVRNQGIPDTRWPWEAIESGYKFARTLEQELAEAHEQIAALREALKNARHALPPASTLVC